MKREAALIFAVITAAFFFFFGKPLLSDEANSAIHIGAFVWLFATIIWASVAITRHADALAERFGEPYGTLILTLAVISIEVVTVSSVMLDGDDNPTIAREAMYGVMMIVLNGIVGVCLLFGGLRHREPEVNVSGARSYLSVLITLAVFTLILPNYTEAHPGPYFSKSQGVFIATAAGSLYLVFLWIQTQRHTEFFVDEEPEKHPHPEGHHALTYKTWIHSALLLGGLFPVFFLCKKIGVVLNFALEKANAPASLGGFFVALMVLAPEGFSALGAAWRNSMQRAVNITLGSALATIGLTVPCIVTVSLVMHRELILGLDPLDSVLLVLTLMVSILTFSTRRANVLLGAVHLVIFACYFVMIFDKAGM